MKAIGKLAVDTNAVIAFRSGVSELNRWARRMANISRVNRLGHERWLLSMLKSRLFWSRKNVSIVKRLA